MYKPPEATRHYKQITILILLPLRADLLCTLHYETPCILGPPAPTVFINDGAPPVIFLILLGLGLVVSAGAVALIGKIFSAFYSNFSQRTTVYFKF